MSNKLTQLITLHEGTELKLYRCSAGKLTIGVGHNIEERGISAAISDAMLQEDINEAWLTLRDRVDCFDELSDVRRGVLVDMCFNLGWPRLSRFKNFLAALDVCSFDTAATEMLNSKWADQVGLRAQRLAVMMRTNSWPAEVE